MAVAPQVARAGGIYVPNNSFETPPVADAPPYAQPELDYWEETPPPAGFSTNEAGFEWFELVGEFYNDPNVPGYLVNATGNQGPMYGPIPRWEYSRITIPSRSRKATPPMRSTPPSSRVMCIPSLRGLLPTLCLALRPGQRCK